MTGGRFGPTTQPSNRDRIVRRRRRRAGCCRVSTRASGTWVARIDGSPGALQYALEVTPGVDQHVGGRRRAGLIALRGLDEMQARSLLDAAETVAVSVALFRTSVDASNGVE